jgi:hypothetical protein
MNDNNNNNIVLFYKIIIAATIETTHRGERDERERQNCLISSIKDRVHVVARVFAF